MPDRKLFRLPASASKVEVQCVECPTRIRFDSGDVFADLNGQPYHDYLCRACAEKHEARVNAEVDSQPKAD